MKNASPRKSNEPADLIGPDEAALRLCVAPETLSNWRSSKKVRIPYYKIGGKVFYSSADIDAFVARCRVEAG